MVLAETSQITIDASPSSADTSIASEKITWVKFLQKLDLRVEPDGILRANSPDNKRVPATVGIINFTSVIYCQDEDKTFFVTIPGEFLGQILENHMLNTRAYIPTVPSPKTLRR